MVVKYAFLFPGQGSQFSGMGKELADTLSVSHDVFEEADQALGFQLSELCFQGADADLALTENTQPAILAHSIAALRALTARGIDAPVATAGHSLGEYSSHVAAGTISFADAIRTVRARGQFMQAAVPVGTGAMAAIIGMEKAQVQELCSLAADGEVVSPANLNSPGQIVIAGHLGAVERAMSLALEKGARKAVQLPVSAPFHCSLMKPAAEELRPVLDGINFEEARFPVYNNVDASPVRSGQESRDALYRQVCNPVRWVETVHNMIDSGVDTFIEIGPGRVLSGLLRRIDRSVIAHAVQDPAGIDAVVEKIMVAD
jgi:[acyl-carrier-protein] S-malonyltransferase